MSYKAEILKIISKCFQKFLRGLVFCTWRFQWQFLEDILFTREIPCNMFYNTYRFEKFKIKFGKCNKI